MKINVKVKTNAKEVSVEQIDEITYQVSVKESPIDGKANRGVTEALAGHFGIARSRVSILAGHVSKIKIIEVK